MKPTSLPSHPVHGHASSSSCSIRPSGRGGSARSRALRRARLWAHDAGPTARRAADIVIASLTLLVLSPLLLIVAAAIKLESRGPILFSQARGGLDGEPFEMIKLRSMVADAEALRHRLLTQSQTMSSPRFKMARDPRITTVGQIIRKLSIDELPQLLNVLRGDMTLIGPRPAPIAECDLYDPLARRRMEVRPGLTCLWQVRGRSDLSFDEQVELDLHYIDRCTPMDDVVILLKTVPAVISGKGAY